MRAFGRSGCVAVLALNQRLLGTVGDSRVFTGVEADVVVAEVVVVARVQ
jgi:hypothetical protein